MRWEILIINSARFSNIESCELMQNPLLSNVYLSLLPLLSFLSLLKGSFVGFQYNLTSFSDLFFFLRWVLELKTLFSSFCRKVQFAESKTRFGFYSQAPDLVNIIQKGPKKRKMKTKKWKLAFHHKFEASFN